jgi:O-antigen/teichoic acid export membrane protein
MATVLCPVYAMLIVLAPSLVEHVLGPRWNGAAPILQILAVAGVIGISYDATAPMLEGRGEPYKVTALYAIISLTVVAFAWWLAGAYGLAGAALAWVLAQSAMLVACVIFSRQILSAPFAHLSRPLLGIALASLGAAGVAWLVDATLPGVVGLGVGIAFAAGTAVMLLWAMDARLDLGLGRDFARAFPGIAQRVRRSPGTG